MYGILRTFFIGGFTTLRPIVLEIKDPPEIQLEIKIKFERSSYCMAHPNLVVSDDQPTPHLGHAPTLLV